MPDKIRGKTETFTMTLVYDTAEVYGEVRTSFKLHVSADGP